jgi:hypothetical protein
MNFRKLALALLVVPMFISLFAGQSLAAWAICTVAKAGYSGSGSIGRIQLKNCNDTTFNGWLSLRAKGSTEMLASALTAGRSGKTVSVETNGSKDSQNYTYIISLLVNF